MIRLIARLIRWVAAPEIWYSAVDIGDDSLLSPGNVDNWPNNMKGKQ